MYHSRYWFHLTNDIVLALLKYEKYRPVSCNLKHLSVRNSWCEFSSSHLFAFLHT